MLPGALLASVLGLGNAVGAFQDTTPLLAFASSPRDCGSALVYHVPGLRASDLAGLDEQSPIRRAWQGAEGGRVHLPYVQPGKEPIDLVLSSIQCQLEQDLQLERVEVFDIGADRITGMRRLDDRVNERLQTIEGDHLLIFVSSPPNPSALWRRQAYSETSRPSLTVLQASGSGNSSWKPDPTAPALAKYTIISPIQILCLVIFLLVLLPSVTLTTGWLTEISTPSGLVSGKFAGTDQKKKDQ